MHKIGAFNKTDSFWISATDLGPEGSFYWDSTGRSMGLHTDWAENQPNNANAVEHCVILGVNNTTEAHLWNDVQCKNINRYICEGKLTGFERLIVRNQFIKFYYKNYISIPLILYRMKQ